MEEKYIIYVIPTSGEKHYVPESEVDNFELDYPDAVLYSESEEFANKDQKEYETATQESQYTDAIEQLEAPVVTNEYTLNQDAKERQAKAIDDLFDPGGKYLDYNGHSSYADQYLKSREGVGDDNIKNLSGGSLQSGKRYMWKDGEENTINLIQTEDGEIDPAAAELGYVEYIPPVKTFDRKQIPTDILTTLDKSSSSGGRYDIFARQEEELVPFFNKIYGDFGFSFSGAKLAKGGEPKHDMFGNHVGYYNEGEVLDDASDMIYVEAADGSKIEIQIDNEDIGSHMQKFGYMGDPNYFSSNSEASKKLRDFLEKHQTEYTPKNIETLEQAEKQGRLTQFYDNEVVDKEIGVIEKKAASIDGLAKLVEEDINTLQNDYNILQESVDKGEIKDQASLDKQIAELKEREAQIKIDQKALKGVYKREVEDQYVAIQQLAAHKVEMDAAGGGQSKSWANTALRSIDDLGEWAEDLAFSTLEYGIKGAQAVGVGPSTETIEQISTDIGRKKIKRKEGESDGDYTQRLVTNMKTFTDNQGRGLLERELGFNKFGHTNEYEKRFQDTTWGAVSTAGVQMLTYALLTRGAGGGGAAASSGRTLVGRAIKDAAKSPLTYMFGMSAAANSMDEMEKPEFEGIPTWEKMAFSNLRGAVQGVLENVGVSGAVNGSRTVNKILSRALKKAGPNATYKTVDALIGSEIKNSLAKGLFRVVGGALVEGETEVVQEIADVGLKNLFNLAHNKGVLKEENSPELFNKKQTDLSLENLIHVGKVGMLSGLMFGGFGATVQAYQENALDRINKKQFKLSEYLVGSPEARKIYAANLRNEIQQGKITKEEASSRLRSVRQMGEVIQQLPKGLTDTGRQKAFALSLEKQKLVAATEGKDKSLYKPQLDRIQEINKELENVAFTETKANQLARNLRLSEQVAGERNVKFKSFKDKEGYKKALEEEGVNVDDVVAFDKEGNALDVGDATDGLYIKTGDGTILINEEVAEKYGAVSVGTHELLHDITRKKLAQGDVDVNELVKDFKSVLSTKEMAAVQKRIDENYGGDPTTEEWFNAFHDAIVKGEIKYNENVFSRIGDWIVDNILRPAGFKKIGFANGRDVYNFIKDYSKQSRAITRGEQEGFTGSIAREVNVKEEAPTAKEKEAFSITVENKINNLGKNVTKEEWDNGKADEVIGELYEDLQGLIKSKIPFNKPPGFSEEDFISGTLAELIPHIRNFNPEVNDSLSGWINSQLRNKIGNVFRKGEALTEEKFTEDISEARGVTAEEEVEVKEEAPTVTLREELGIEKGSELYNSIISAVRKTFGTELPEVTSAKFKKELMKAYKTELKKSLQDFMGTRQGFRDFLNKNFKTLLRKIPQSTMNKRFSQFVEPVLDESGKQVREKTAQGNAVFRKRDVKRPEFLNYFLGTEVGGSTKGTRKDALAESIAQELAFDATMEVLKDPKVIEKREAIQDLKNQEKLQNENALIAKAIDRDPTKINFSKSAANLIGNNKQEFLNNFKDLLNSINETGGNVKLAFDSVFGPEFLKRSPKKRQDIINEIQDYVNRYKKQKEVYVSNSKISPVKLANFIKQEMDEITMRTQLKTVLGLGKDGLSFSNLSQIQSQRNTVQEFVTEMFKKDGPDKTLKFVVNMMGKAINGSGKVGNGAYKYNESTGQWEEGRGGATRYSIYDGNKAMMNQLIKPAMKAAGLDPDLVTIKETGSGSRILFNGESLVETKYPENTSSIATGKFDFEGRKISADEDAKAFKKLVNWYKKRIEDGVPNAKNDFGMMLMGLNGDMRSILRSMANLRYVAEGPGLTNRPSDFRYEHLIPARVIVLETAGYANNLRSEQQLDELIKDYSVAIIPKTMDDIINIDYKDSMPGDWAIGTDPLLRYYNFKTYGSFPVQLKDLSNNKIADISSEQIAAYNTVNKARSSNKSLNTSSGVTVSPSISIPNSDVIQTSITLDGALENARSLDQPVKKIRVFDFDDTLAYTKSNVFYTDMAGKKGQLTAEEFAKKGKQLLDEGYTFDFSDFNKVKEGKKGPLFKVAEKIKAARGNEDLFVLTARAPEAAPAIYEFLKSQGLEIPLKNITGLGNSTGEAKAQWLVGKAAEGYNDFYFADDAVANVKAVKKAMSVLDVKSKVQQAMPKFSITLDKEFNNIIEENTNISSEREYSAAKAKTLGASKDKFKLFVPHSAEDFLGLIYRLVGKGRVGDQQLAWFKQNLLDPYARAMSDISRARINLMQDFKALKKNLKTVPKTLRKKTADGFTYEQAVRAFIWNKQGDKIPGIDAGDMREFRKIVLANEDLRVFAEELMQINKGLPYPAPDASWLAGNITSDLINGLNTQGRKKFLSQWQQNADAIFSEKNLNKLEAIHGAKYREALENILARMKSGTNRLTKGNRLSDRVLNYINGSIGAIMFFNMRSAVLQTISAVNFINWSDNNPLKAGKAFANQGQYWKDFKELMNSDYLVDRRQGLRLNINENEIANLAKTSKNKAKAALGYILQKGYLPTQFADSFAIASGGATFYRNRVNTYIKQGMTESEAKAKAMLDFRQIAEESQQSSNPARISQQQASDLGRIILAFANTPMQYTRLTKRALQDLKNRRGDWKTNMSKVIYYTTVQNLIFNALQQAVFALGFGDDDDDEAKKKKYQDVANGMLDSFLRGMGIAGAALSVGKNFMLDVYERSGRARPEYVDATNQLLKISPPISSKMSKLRQAAWLFDSKKRRQEMIDKGFSLDNPAYEALAKVITATTNVPLDRLLLKADNISNAVNEDLETWEKIASLLGWPQWQLEPKSVPKPKPKKEKSKTKRSSSRGGGRVQKRAKRRTKP